MNIYEINRAIEACVDNESGEIIDASALESLIMERDEKIENIGCWVKNLVSDIGALKTEIDNLTSRKKVCENKVEGLKKYLSDVLCGQGFETAKVKIGFRKSTSIECDEDFAQWCVDNNRMEFLKFKAPEISKTAIKECGEELPHCRVVEKLNIGIK